MVPNMILIHDPIDRNNKIGHTRVFVKSKRSNRYYVFLAVLTVLLLVFTVALANLNIGITTMVTVVLIVGSIAIFSAVPLKGKFVDGVFIGCSGGNLVIYSMNNEGKAQDVVKLRFSSSIIKDKDSKNRSITFGDGDTTYELRIFDSYDYEKTLQYIDIALSNDLSGLMMD